MTANQDSGPTGRMNIVLGYVPTPAGRAAVERAIHFARLDDARLTVVATGDYGDPVVAWGSVVQDEEAARRYKSARGKGGLVRATWEEVTDMVAGPRPFHRNVRTRYRACRARRHRPGLLHRNPHRDPGGRGDGLRLA